MTANRLAVGAVTFLVLVAGIVGAAAAGPLVLTQEPTPASATVPASFEPGSTSVETSQANGDVTVDANSTGDVVLVDLAHGNDQTAEQVQTLERVLVESGYEVRFYGSASGSGSASPFAGLTGGAVSAGPSGFGSQSRSQQNLNASLRAADAYVVVNPAERFDTSEVNGITAFADAGGRVLVFSDPSSRGLASLLGAGSGGSPSPTAPMLSRFGVGAGSGYLYNMAENDGNFQTVFASGATGELGDGVDRVSLHRAAPVVTGPDATVGLHTTAGTELSDSGAAGQYAVAARNGNVSIVGDASILDPANLRRADNEVLVGNLVEFLVGGTVPPDVPGSSKPDVPTPPVNRPPNASFTPG